MIQLRLDFTHTKSDNWYEFYCPTCCNERSETVKFHREQGLTKMFGWDKRLGYSCEGCGHVYFLSYIQIYSSNFKGGFWRTLEAAGWHESEVLVWLWNTNFFNGGDVFDIPTEKREAFETQCRKAVAESERVDRLIKEKYG